MVNILVPTDFSPLSRFALKYAIKIANRLDGNITVLHIVTMTRALRFTMLERMRAADPDRVSSAERDLEKMIKTLSEQYKSSRPIKYEVVRGAYFPSTLLREA